MLREHQAPRQRPGHAGGGQGNGQEDGPDQLPARAQRGLSGRPRDRHLHPRLPARLDRRAGARLRERDLRRTAEAAPAEGLRRGRQDRRGGRRGELRRVPARAGGTRPASGRLARAAAKPAPREAAPGVGRLDQAHPRPRAPARGRGGAALRDRQGSAERRVGSERRRDRRPRPERRLHPRHGLEPDLRAEALHGPRQRETTAQRRPRALDGRSGELPVAEPRDQRRLSGRLDLQAGHGARGARNTRDHALFDSSLHRLVHGLQGGRLRPGGPGVLQLGPVRQFADEPAHGDRGLLRHVLLPTRLLASTRSRRARAIRSRPGRRSSASVGERASTSGPSRPGCCRRPSGAGGPSRARPTRATGRSTNSGSRATRSSSRSARRTCS